MKVQDWPIGFGGDLTARKCVAAQVKTIAHGKRADNLDMECHRRTGGANGVWGLAKNASEGVKSFLMNRVATGKISGKRQSTGS